MKIHIDKLTKTYGSRKVLDVENLSLETGMLYGVIGANGAGKSTLLRILGSFEQKTSGEIFYDGSVWNDRLTKQVTYMSQKPYMLRTSVFSNIAYPLKVRKFSRELLEFKVNKIMKELDLYDLRNQLATNLSGGEAQKVAFARALVFEPRFLLMDEPTSNIDPESILLIEDLILKRCKKDIMTTIMITHSLDQAMRLCDELIVMNQGIIEDFGDAKKIITMRKRQGGFECIM